MTPHRITLSCLGGPLPHANGIRSQDHLADSTRPKHAAASPSALDRLRLLRRTTNGGKAMYNDLT
jgi:hypothetical protein